MDGGCGGGCGGRDGDGTVSVVAKKFEHGAHIFVIRALISAIVIDHFFHFSGTQSMSPRRRRRQTIGCRRGHELGGFGGRGCGGGCVRGCGCGGGSCVGGGGGGLKHFQENISQKSTIDLDVVSFSVFIIMDRRMIEVH